jgi:hypothetical protein
MQTIRLCSEAIARIPVQYMLISMWEDSDLEAYEGERAFAGWLDQQVPGAFVLVERWNSVDAPCYQRHISHYDTCGVYKPDYALILVPASTWAAVQADALGIQAEHEAAGRRCQQDDPTPQPHIGAVPF